MQGGLVKLRGSNHHCLSETQIFALGKNLRKWDDIKCWTKENPTYKSTFQANEKQDFGRCHLERAFLHKHLSKKRTGSVCYEGLVEAPLAVGVPIPTLAGPPEVPVDRKKETTVSNTANTTIATITSPPTSYKIHHQKNRPMLKWLTQTATHKISCNRENLKSGKKSNPLKYDVWAKMYAWPMLC